MKQHSMRKRIPEAGKVAGYKVNTQKWVALLYTYDKQSEIEIEEAIPFKIALPKKKRKKMPWNTANQGHGRLYIETKTSEKDTKETQRDGKIPHARGLEEAILWK